MAQRVEYTCKACGHVGDPVNKPVKAEPKWKGLARAAFGRGGLIGAAVHAAAPKQPAKAELICTQCGSSDLSSRIVGS